MGNINLFGFPFTSVNSDRQYSSAEWREYFEALVVGGIVGEITNELKVNPQAIPNKTVFVDTGSILIKGAMRSMTSVTDLTCADNASGNPRIDRIVVRLNYTDRKIEFAVKQGTPAASPSAPALTRDATAWEFSLAQIALANGYTTITAGVITDERADEALCGYFKYRAKPAWYPGGEVPIDAWMYIAFKNELTAQEILDIEANPTLMAIINNSSVASSVSESVTVNVSTENAQAVAGQVITMTDLTVSADSTTYTLLTGETSAIFKVVVGHSYNISINAKSGYATPSGSATFSAIAGNTRTISFVYELVKRYGFRRAKTNSDPSTRIEYLFDAVGFTPAYFDTTGGSFVSGSWATFITAVQRQVMLKDDGTVDYELSQTDDTKKVGGVIASDVSNTSYAGNAMVEFRKYKWVYQYEDATYEYFICSNTQYSADYKAYAFTNALGHVEDAFYWGKYKGINVGNKLRSFADQAVMVSQTRNTEVAYANAIGSGYHTIYKSGWDYICDLLTLISKSDNSQLKFGTGRSKSTNTTAINTGSLKAFGLFKGYTDETSDVKVFGIEGFWGNVWEGIAGLVFNSAIKTKLVPPYNFDGTGYTNTTIVPSGTSGGYVNTAKVDPEMGYVPKTASGSGTTYYCDGLWFNNAQVDYALVGGNWHYAALDGSRCVGLSDLASSADAGIGSRLSYINPA